MSRKSARESTMKLLFEISWRMDEKDDILGNFLNENNLDENDREYIKSTVNGTIDHLNSIDSMIENYTKGWKTQRLAKIDLAVLRLAIYEIYHTDTPESVVINEAVELAKKYGTEKSGAFVNGVLSSVSKDRKKTEQ